MANKWDRMKFENTLWHGRFDNYRMMGEGRSIVEIYNQEREQVGAKRRNSAPGTWAEAARKFQWKERAQSWDDYERHKTRVENEKERQKARKARVVLIMAGIEKCRESLDICDPTNAKFGEIMTGIKTLNEQARIEFGESPTVTEFTFVILRGVSTGELSIRDAAVRFNQEGLTLPKSIETMLTKEPPEEDDLDGTEGILSEEDLDRRYEEAMASLDSEQKKFLPERRREVAAIKDELSDNDQWKPDENTDI